MALQVDSTPSPEVQHVEQQVTLPSDMENKEISGLSQAGTYPEGGKGWFVLIGVHLQSTHIDSSRISSFQQLGRVSVSLPNDSASGHQSINHVRRYAYPF
ncbi:hypothetical protein FRC03_008915 [Tulasnella sp. 419]|nr:hypothetical protein FRC03_008915 [Tulasnella sp. 419]